ncbi:MAG: ribosome silencing factor, partial [Candidatus Marinimicrobia bacterium]|nr:ribosome silencing factor [Candidatus Neomarinimicrobiota bacterium]
MVRPKTIAKFMLEKKATNIKIFDVRKITSITDFFIVCNASSEPQIKAILNHISRSLKKKGMRPVNIEGQDRNDWILIDYFDFIIHIFSEDKRSF